MKFYKIVGDVKTPEAEKIIEKCQTVLSEAFTEISGGSAIKLGSKFGGDPLIMQLVVPMNHYCDMSGYNYLSFKKPIGKIQRKLDLAVPISKEDKELLEEEVAFKKKHRYILETAATNGKEYFWAPHFVVSKSKVGVRLLIYHEGMHSALMHPNRRGHRNPDLWNKAIDYKANHNAMCDIRAKTGADPKVLFKELGDYITIEEYASFIRDPYNPPEKMKKISPRYQIERMLEKDYIEKDDEPPFLLFADPVIPKDLEQPEAIYNYLLKQAPKCNECGKTKYKVPEDIKEKKLKIKHIRESNAKNS